MLHSIYRAGLFAVLLGFLLAPGGAWSQDKRVRHVQDDAGLFSKVAEERANRVIETIAERHHKELFIETVKEGPAKAEQSNWARTRFNNYKMDGVYVVFGAEPKFYRIEVGNKTRSDGWFTAENIRSLEKLIESKQSPDEMLARITNYTLDTMNQHAPKKSGAAAPKGGAPVPKDDAATTEFPPWLGWVCMIGAVLLVIWVVFAIIRALTGSAGGGYNQGPGPGYGGAGYGGGGGGGFFTGMLGGLFGSMAGMWMYNNFFGGHANYSTGNWGGGSQGGTGPAAANPPYQGDTDTGASGGGNDWGGGTGGDAGGADAGGGGGAWGGGGDAGGDAAPSGGGDWASGQKDGGDWGGGGDAGGGAAPGGGDWAGGQKDGGDWGGGGGGGDSGGGDWGGGGGGDSGGGGDGGGGGGDW